MKSSLHISLKKADFSDIEFFWYLRNRLYVYKYSRQKKLVKWEEHIDWIMPVILGLSKRDLFVIKKATVSVGQIRFDYKNNIEAEISISILKEFQGQGIASMSLDKAIKKIKKERKIKKITAEINKNNASSIKLFSKLGFEFENERKDWLKYSIKL